MEETNDLEMPTQPLKALKSSVCTDVILKTIIDHFAVNDAPIDVKEMAESIEFYLRTRRRLMGAAKKRNAKNVRIAKEISKDENENEDSTGGAKRSPTIIHVYDLCSGHGLTGMLFAACNPPNDDRIVKTYLVDMVEPPSHEILRDLIAEVCPWIKSHDTVQFSACPLESFAIQETEIVCPIVIATHACGTLTDKVLEEAVKMEACAIAAMPCCYTGTDKGTPYGIKRAMGVSWAADIRRTYYLDDHNFHTDYSTIPLEITPLNRIIVAEDRS